MKNVVIIGGGPSGSTLASYLSLAGIPNTVYEAAVHPRPHVGESLVPVTTRVFDEIGFLQTMEDEGFVRKYGASWHPPTRQREISIDFKEFPQDGVDQDYTYHVDRASFDHKLLRHAAGLGSRVHENADVKRVLLRDERVCGVEVELDGETQEIEADFVVDASGRRAVLGRQLGMFKKDKQFDQFAVHAWFKHVNRSNNNRQDDIHIYFINEERGWVWQIPISEEVTSIGVVVDRKIFKATKNDIEAWFTSMVQSTPNTAAAMKDAVRINDFKREGDYTYSMERFAGPGYLLSGDAARFVDPIFSSGVSVALYSAKFAAETLRSVIQDGASESEAFASYEQRLRAGCDVWYEFICLYYRLLPLFTLFIRDPRYREQIHRLLQGDVYDRAEVPVLDKMREFITAVEANGAHLMHGYLGNVDLAVLDEFLTRN